MTRATNARIAGFTFLAYIAAGITSMVLFRRAASGEGTAAKLAGIAAAMLGLVCRVGEGVIAALSIPAMLTLFWLATVSGADAPDTAAAHALAAYLLRDDVALTATFFAVGSTAFTYLLLRGQMVPVPLAWLGVVASVLLLIGLPLQLAGWLHGPITSLMWLPMLAFEVPLGLWLVTRGVAADPHARAFIRSA